MKTTNYPIRRRHKNDIFLKNMSEFEGLTALLKRHLSK